MNIIREESIRTENLRDIANKMLIAARTAPKGRGEDNLVLALIEQPDINTIADKLLDMGRKYDLLAFVRDSESIRLASCLVLLGTKIKPLGLKRCGMCGFKNCQEKNNHPDIPCVFNTGDLGIALGSAVSVASQHRVDNRIMYTVGQVVLELKLLEQDVKIVYAIPLSATSKNPFFDRKD